MALLIPDQGRQGVDTERIHPRRIDPHVCRATNNAVQPAGVGHLEKQFPRRQLGCQQPHDRVPVVGGSRSCTLERKGRLVCIAVPPRIAHPLSV